jgi:hypothetical protein
MRRHISGLGGISTFRNVILEEEPIQRVRRVEVRGNAESRDTAVRKRVCSEEGVIICVKCCWKVK